MIGEEILYLFYYFFIYSIIGWVWETCLCSFKERKFIYRGFLNGPYCPIYGVGMTVIIISLYKISNNILLLFIFGTVICTLLEYFTGMILEKLFHLTLWDYSNYKFNINGKICPLVSLFWGILSVLIMTFVQPFFNGKIKDIPNPYNFLIIYVLVFIFATDIIITLINIIKLKIKVNNLEEAKNELKIHLKESNVYKSINKQLLRTSLRFEELTSEIKSKLNEKSFRSNKYSLSEYSEKLNNLHLKYKLNSKINFIQKRILKAYPKFKFNKNDDNLKDIKKNI